jgi:hypothetical protein
VGCTFYTQCPQTDTGGAGTGTSGGAGNGSAGDGSGNSAGLEGLGGGTVSGEWRNVTSNLAGVPTECGTLSMVSSKPDEDMLIAGIALSGLWSSTDGGGAWTPLGQGKGSDVIVNRPKGILYDPDTPEQYWEYGLYNSGGGYVTTDNGDTFTQLGDQSNSDLLSIDFSDPARNLMLMGGHEAPQAVYRSKNGGSSWSLIGSALPTDIQCTFPLIIDAQTYLVGCSGAGGSNVIYRTSNGSASWTQTGDAGGSAAPLRTSEGTLYWAASNPNGLVRSSDEGKTWSALLGRNVVRNTTPIELPDKRIATLGEHAVVASSDQGATWSAITAPYPYEDAVGLSYSPFQKALYIWRSQCGASSPEVPDNSIMAFDLDATSN